MTQSHIQYVLQSISKNIPSSCLPRIRGSGTAATNMCLVASGAVEAFFEIGIHCWDIAAGAVIVTEAGGVLMDVDGRTYDNVTLKQCHTEMLMLVVQGTH